MTHVTSSSADARSLPATAASATPALAPSSSLPDEVRSTYDFMPATLAGYAAGVGVVAMQFWNEVPASLMSGWIAAFALMGLGRLLLAQRFKRADPRSEADWKRWRLYANVGTLVAGALWGLTGWIFYFRGASIQQTGLIVIVYTFCASAVPVLAIQPRMFLAFVSLAFVPLIVRVASGASIYHYQLAGELLLIISLTTVLARYYRQALRRAIDLKVHADQLLAALRIEKLAADTARQQADVARQQAETANRAKTQFFTAASHDLRQPLHAMGLFAEALRQRVHEPEVAQLVNSINESVDALEGLFSELLDITRIDSGGVEVHPQPFVVGDILRKLRLHFEPTAFEKGLSLRLRGGTQVVQADPLLVERILRNLVSNAIRYTNDGSVLVSCRRRGDRVLLQVWDTGVGIRDEQQDRIFDEFYQVPNSVSLSPEQRKGLGLGLAIVKRLAELMKASLTLRSQPGRGSVFTLELPLGRAPRVAASALPAKGPLALTLHGRLLVLVEDEPAVRQGLDVLLKGWGADTIAFDSVAACEAWLADPGAATPDLAIVDYRLEGGRTGVEAIQLLRRRFGAALPTIVVTGSTMSGFEHEALEHDFHLLIKPVLPNKLRAMMAFKLGVKASG